MDYRRAIAMRAVAGTLVVLAVSLPTVGGRTGNEFTCADIPAVCQHLSDKFGDNFNVDNLMSEITVPDLEPFLPGVKFILTNVDTEETTWYIVDLLTTFPSHPGDEITSSVSPVLRNPDPQFLRQFEGVDVGGVTNRARYARAIAAVLAEMTYAGTVTDEAVSGSVATAVLRYKDQPIRRVVVSFDADNRSRGVTVEAYEPANNGEGSVAESQEELSRFTTVGELVAGLAASGVPDDVTRVDIASVSTKLRITVEREGPALGVSAQVCGTHRDGASAVLIGLAATHGLTVRQAIGGDCSSYKVFGDLTNEALSETVGGFCTQVYGLSNSSSVSVTMVGSTDVPRPR